MARKQKYYVVWQGLNPGVYDSWEKCQQQIKNYTGARYKSFASKAIAEQAFAEGPEAKISQNPPKKKISREQAALIGNPVTPSLAVDAACSGNPGTMEYQGVNTADGTPLFHQGPYPDATVNIGEFLAIVHGLAYLKKHNSTIPIYTDSKTAISWVKKKKANTKLERTPKNKTVFDLINRAETWLKTNDWPNQIRKWQTDIWGEIPADFGRK
ncbi:MAG: viroplasmin family protein [Bacteroidota bacterium]